MITTPDEQRKAAQDNADKQSEQILQAIIMGARALKEIADAARDIHAVLEAINRELGRGQR